jgi:hypothetical protein
MYFLKVNDFSSTVVFYWLLYTQDAIFKRSVTILAIFFLFLPLSSFLARFDLRTFFCMSSDRIQMRNGIKRFLVITSTSKVPATQLYCCVNIL